MMAGNMKLFLHVPLWKFSNAVTMAVFIGKGEKIQGTKFAMLPSLLPILEFNLF
jgi:hypothetical protein